MDASLHPSQSGEHGFTLVEILVVILVIGILAAIALPNFLGEGTKAHDAEAKSHARNLAGEMEACWRSANGYNACDGTALAGTGLPIGSTPGTVRVVSTTNDGYELESLSEGKTGGTNHVFRLRHNVGGVYDRRCTPLGEGGCRVNGGW